MKTLDEITEVVSRVSFPAMSLSVANSDRHGLYLQVECEGLCNDTDKPVTWKGRKWLLSQHMTDGEIVQTCFKAILTALEHEARENFTYRGERIFDPHFDIERLVELRRSPGAIRERTPQ